MPADEKTVVPLEELAAALPEAAALVPASSATPARLPSEQKQLDKLRAREDRILEKAMATVEDAMAGADVDDGSDDIPLEWIKDIGTEGAQRRARVAQDARKSPKEHPVYLDMAKSVMVGIIKARASQATPDISLNFNLTIAAPAAAREVIDIEPEEETEK